MWERCTFTVTVKTLGIRLYKIISVLQKGKQKGKAKIKTPTS